MNMPLFIVWNESNAVGIQLLDEQHRGIVSIINTFYHLMHGKKDHQLLYSIISDTMRTYSKLHFITEESFLDIANYKDIAEHKKTHEKLFHQIDVIERQCIKENDAEPLLEFLKYWWLRHINVDDKQYAPTLLQYRQP